MNDVLLPHLKDLLIVSETFARLNRVADSVDSLL